MQHCTLSFQKSENIPDGKYNKKVCTHRRSARAQWTTAKPNRRRDRFGIKGRHARIPTQKTKRRHKNAEQYRSTRGSALPAAAVWQLYAVPYQRWLLVIDTRPSCVSDTCVCATCIYQLMWSRSACSRKRGSYTRF